MKDVLNLIVFICMLSCEPLQSVLMRKRLCFRQRGRAGHGSANASNVPKTGAFLSFGFSAALMSFSLSWLSCSVQFGRRGALSRGFLPGIPTDVSRTRLLIH